MSYDFIRPVEGRHGASPNEATKTVNATACGFDSHSREITFLFFRSGIDANRHNASRKEPENESEKNVNEEIVNIFDIF